MIKESTQLMQATYDCIFKAVMLDPSTREYLKQLIHYITNIPLKYLDNMTVQNVEHLVDNKKDKKMKSDIIVSVGNKKINVEMNREYYKGLFIRNSGYLHKIEASLYKEDEDYINVSEVIQINFDKFHHFGKNKEIYEFIYKEVETGEILEDMSKIYHVDMEFIHDMCYNKPVVNLSRFQRECLLLMAETKEEAIKLAGDDNVMKKVSDKLIDLSKDEKIIGLYDAEVEEEKIRRTLLKGAKMEGLEEGHAEGYVEGIVEGKSEEKMEIAKNMLKETSDIQFISRVTGLSIEEINSLS